MFNSQKYMQRAFEEAEESLKKDEVPIGAIIIDDKGVEVASAYNLCESNNDATAHAEMLVIKAASKKLGTKNLLNCSLYVTLEPCPMCAQAISFSRIKTLVYGASDKKSGGVENGARIFSQQSCHYKPEIISGIMEDRCSKLLKEFFANKR